jgi:hypothetical protein
MRATGQRFTGASLGVLARVLRLEVLFAEWASRGALFPEVVTLAEQCVSALFDIQKEDRARSRRFTEGHGANELQK